MINKSKVIHIVALARLARHERLQSLIAEASGDELACALARMPDPEKMDLLEAMDERARQSACMPLTISTGFGWSTTPARSIIT